MKKLTPTQIVHMCLNNPRLGFSFKPTLQEVESALDRQSIIIDTFDEMYEQNNIYLSLSFDLHGHEGALNINLIFDESDQEWVAFFDGSGPDWSYFDLDETTNKYVIHRG